jgi:hypothetical protein
MGPKEQLESKDSQVFKGILVFKEPKEFKGGMD